MFKQEIQRQAAEANGNRGSHKKVRLYAELEHNLEYIRTELGPSTDLTLHRFKLGDEKISAAAVYMEGLTDKQAVNTYIFGLQKILSKEVGNLQYEEQRSFLEEIRSNAPGGMCTETLEFVDELILTVLSGNTVLLIDGEQEALSGSTSGGEVRSVTEPSSQVVIRGPKDGFTESIGTNVALVRRRIKSSQLWLEKMKIGEVTQTDVAIMYLKGVVNEKLLQEMRSRLKAITYDSILESGYIEHFIEEKTRTPFPTIYNTERPDTVAANILEGRIAIFVDGTPFVLIAPTSFFLFFQASEDYYQRVDVASAIRLLRYLAFLISMFGPSIYIAAITFHQEMIPTPLLISLATQRESVPFPAFVEAMIMEVTFEILREAGVRMPRAIGQAVSIVGALVLGQAAVEAGIISSVMVIVVAITGISSFATPAFSMALAVRLIRFVIMVCAALLGFFGIAMGSIFLLAHMCALRSFGVSYLTPLTPFVMGSQRDTLIRASLKNMRFRPKFLHTREPDRQESSTSNEQADGRERHE